MATDVKCPGKRGAAKLAPRPPTLAAAKAHFVLEVARAGNLLRGEKTHLLSARLNEALVTAAKQRTGIVSDTQLVELALASLAVGDDFGEWLATQGGRLKADFDIDL
jgi:dTDP-4-amino-4,6-dideoxygalactose transaminase